MLYTYSELRKLLRNVSQPSSDILGSLLKPARSWETDSGTMKTLKDITRRCNTCQRFIRGLTCFRVFPPRENNIVFEDKLPIGIAFLDSDKVLQTWNTATRFSAAAF